MPIVAVHLGIVDEDAILNMSWVFFSDILNALGHKFNYDGIVNYAGNSNCEKAWEMIAKSNPLNMSDKGTRQGGGGLAKLLNSGMVHIKGADKAL